MMRGRERECPFVSMSMPIYSPCQLPLDCHWGRSGVEWIWILFCYLLSIETKLDSQIVTRLLSRNEMKIQCLFGLIYYVMSEED